MEHVPYHRLARMHPRYAWWKLPLTGVLAIVLYFGAMTMLFATLAIASIVFDTRSVDDLLSSELNVDARNDPFMLAFAFGGIALMLPALLASAWIVGPRPPLLGSIRGGLRWGWLARTVGVAVLVFAGLAVVLLLLSEHEAKPLDSTAWISVGLILALTPFQAAAEEYVFRGYLIQLVGSWVKWPAVVVAVTLPLFVLGHAYGVWGMIDVAIFGLAASWLVLRTSGLEASIALHTANNISLGLLEILGVLDADSDVGANAWNLVPTVVVSAIFIGLIELLMRWRPPALLPHA